MRGDSYDRVPRGTKAACGSRELLEAFALLHAGTKQVVDVSSGREPSGTRLIEVVDVR